jgi:hypothetical protein
MMQQQMTGIETTKEKLPESEEFPELVIGTKTEPVSVITEAGLYEGQYIIEPLSEIGGFKFGSGVEKMNEIFGEPKSITGYAYMYPDSGIVFIIKSDSTIDAVFCGNMTDSNSVMIKNCRYRTTEDIGMGSSREDVISAYGQPSSLRKHPDGSETVTLEYRDINSRFTIKDNKVVHMIFRKAR